MTGPLQHPTSAAKLLVSLVLWATSTVTACAESNPLFYYVPSDDGWVSLSQHASKIALLAPQVFMLDESGAVRGQVEPRVRSLALQYAIELMPLLANEKPEAAHNMLVNPVVRKQVISDSLRLCQEAGCVGLQLDIEGVLQEDGERFTEFVREAAEAFHQQHLQISVAIPSPLLTPSPKEKYNDWFGGFVVYHEPYAMEPIARSVDFITLMTYGQFGNGTPPGPVAGLPWVEQSIRYALQFVPREKLSMGLGFWSYRWCGQQVTYSGYPEIEEIRSKSGASPQWQRDFRAPWFEYDGAGCRTTVWFENRHSLHEKIKLAHHYHLRGFSGWRLGQEDPEFWEEVRETPAGKRARKAAPPEPEAPPKVTSQLQ